MFTIAQLSDRLGEHIGKKAGLEWEIGKISYGVECVFVFLFSIGTILFFGWLTDTFRETLMITLGYFLMKSLIGGPHLSGFLRCLGYSVFLIVGTGFLFKTGYENFSLLLLIILTVTGSLVIFNYAPMLTVNKHFTGEQNIRRRLIAVTLLLIVAVINIFAWNYNWIGLLIGISISVFNISPVGSSLVQWVDSVTKRKEVC